MAGRAKRVKGGRTDETSLRVLLTREEMKVLEAGAEAAGERGVSSWVRRIALREARKLL
jgi:hypothetical protein